MTEVVKFIKRRIEHAKRRIKETKAKQGTIVENDDYWNGFDLGYWKGIRSGYQNALDKLEEEQNGKSTQNGNLPD